MTNHTLSSKLEYIANDLEYACNSEKFSRVKFSVVALHEIAEELRKTGKVVRL